MCHNSAGLTRTDPPLYLAAAAAANDSDVGASAAVIVPGDDHVVRETERNAFGRAGTAIKQPEDARTAVSTLNDKVVAAVAVIVARSREVINFTPRGVRNRTARSRTIEPITGAPRTI